MIDVLIILKNIFNPNTFDTAFTNIGGTKPPDDIRDLIDKIHKDAVKSDAKKDISVYIKHFMTPLLNNRVGTFLNETEIKSIRKDDASPFDSGKVVVYEEQNETYKFVIYIGINNDKAVIYTKANPKDKSLVQSEVERSNLYNFYGDIIQTFDAGNATLNEDNLLETYVIGKIKE